MSSTCRSGMISTTRIGAPFSATDHQDQRPTGPTRAARVCLVQREFHSGIGTRESPLLVVGGYTATIRPRASYTNALKRQQIVAYGYPDTDPRGYEEDHLIALELGGAPSDQCNLWPEPAHSPNPKDKVENVLRQRVCAGSLTLVEAQQRIATDWTTAAL